MYIIFITEDTELVYWTIGLIHEFAVKDIARNEISNIKGLLKIMLSHLNNDEASIPRVLIRTLKCLGVGNGKIIIIMNEKFNSS